MLSLIGSKVVESERVARERGMTKRNFYAYNEEGNAIVEIDGCIIDLGEISSDVSKVVNKLDFIEHFAIWAEPLKGEDILSGYPSLTKDCHSNMMDCAMFTTKESGELLTIYYKMKNELYSYTYETDSWGKILMEKEEEESDLERQLGYLRNNALDRSMARKNFTSYVDSGYWFMEFDGCVVELGSVNDNNEPTRDVKMKFATHFCNNAELLDKERIDLIRSVMYPSAKNSSIFGEFSASTIGSEGEILSIFYVSNGKVYMYYCQSNVWTEVRTRNKNRMQENNSSSEDNAVPGRLSTAQSTTVVSRINAIKRIAEERGMRKSNFNVYAITDNFSISVDGCMINFGSNLTDSDKIATKLKFVEHFAMHAEPLNGEDIISQYKDFTGDLTTGEEYNKFVCEYTVTTAIKGGGGVVAVYYKTHKGLYSYTYATDCWGEINTQKDSDICIQDTEKLIEIHSLWGKGELLGFRITEGNVSYDISSDVANKYGVSRTGNKIAMRKLKSGLWVSESEYTNKRLVKDISDDTNKIKELINKMYEQG